VAIALLTSIVRDESIDSATLVAVALGVGGGIAITSGALSAVDRRLWRTGLFRRLRLPDAPPVLHGTWRTSVYSKLRGQLDGFLVIDQRFSVVTTLLLFPDGDSRSMVAVLTRTPYQRWELWFFYDFRPHDPDDDLGWRLGAAVLYVPTQGPVTLHGEFWNTLEDRGPIKGVAHVPVLLSSYDVAKAEPGLKATARPLSNIVCPTCGTEHDIADVDYRGSTRAPLLSGGRRVASARKSRSRPSTTASWAALSIVVRHARARRRRSGLMRPSTRRRRR
jgi:hypothetical protein